MNILNTKFVIVDFLKQRKSPKQNKIDPWAISPNMTPNKNGKVTKVKKPGLAYLYLGTPYV